MNTETFALVGDEDTVEIWRPLTAPDNATPEQITAIELHNEANAWRGRFRARVRVADRGAMSDWLFAIDRIKALERRRQRAISVELELGDARLSAALTPECRAELEALTHRLFELTLVRLEGPVVGSAELDPSTVTGKAAGALVFELALANEVREACVAFQSPTPKQRRLLPLPRGDEGGEPRGA